MARARKLGNHDASGEVGCHGAVVVGTSASGDFDLAPNLGKTACQAGDIHASFALAEAAHSGVLGDFDHLEDKKLPDGLGAGSRIEDSLRAAELERSSPEHRFAEDRPHPMAIAAKRSRASRICPTP